MDLSLGDLAFMADAHYLFELIFAHGGHHKNLLFCAGSCKLRLYKNCFPLMF